MERRTFGGIAMNLSHAHPLDRYLMMLATDRAIAQVLAPERSNRPAERAGENEGAIWDFTDFMSSTLSRTAAQLRIGTDDHLCGCRRP